MFKQAIFGISLSLAISTTAQADVSQTKNPVLKLGWQVGASTHHISTSKTTIQTAADEAFLKGRDAHEYMRLSEGHNHFKPDALVVKLKGPKANSVVTFLYGKTGYVRMDDWKSTINSDQILKTIQENTQEANKIRAAGYAKIYVDGWAEPPRLDRKNAVVYWAIRGHSEDGQKFINAKAIKLGRKGMSSLVWIGSPRQFQGAMQSLKPALEAYQHQSGFRYADFQPNVDKVAAFGVGAIAYKMLTGKSSKVAASVGAGTIAIALAFAKKLWFLILLPFVWLWNFIRNAIFTGNSTT
jgi:uncharacterized membrane-anchored protein